MVSRFAGRLLTSPVAFFVAGAIDIGWLLWIYARWRVTQRRAGGGAGAKDAGAGAGEAFSPPS
jgi:hypothetical protein